MSNDELKETAAVYVAVPPDSPYAALAEEIFWERVERARVMPGDQKLLAGQELFESACEITLAGIRHQFPGHSEEHYREVLRKRLADRRKRQALE